MRLYIATMSRIKGIFIYSDYPSKSLSIERIIAYLRDYGLYAEDRGNFFEFLNLAEEKFLNLARKIAGTKVFDVSIPLDEIQKLNYGEIDAELKRIKGRESYLRVGAISFADSARPTTRTIHELPLLYDGIWLQRIFHKIMAEKVPDEFKSGFIHVIFTSRLFGTFETSGSLNTLPLDGSVGSGGRFYRTPHSYPRSQRYHVRVIITGLPSLISTSGIVEAPARPKEYYWLKAGFIQGGKDAQELDLIYRGRFIEYDDSKITSVLGPYVLQAIFYELTGNPFCGNPSCCLYNSHWQEEVLKAQLEGKLCEEHRNIIK